MVPRVRIIALRKWNWSPCSGRVADVVVSRIDGNHLITTGLPTMPSEISERGIERRILKITIILYSVSGEKEIKSIFYITFNTFARMQATSRMY